MLPSVLWSCFLFCLFGKQQYSNKGKQEVHEFYSPNNNQQIIANEFPRATREDYMFCGRREKLHSESPSFDSEGAYAAFPVFLTGSYFNPLAENKLLGTIYIINACHLSNQSTVFTECLLHTQVGMFRSILPTWSLHATVVVHIYESK